MGKRGLRPANVRKNVSAVGKMAKEGGRRRLSKHYGVSRDESPGLAGFSKECDPRRRSLECTSKSYLAMIAITTCHPARKRRDPAVPFTCYIASFPAASRQKF